MQKTWFIFIFLMALTMGLGPSAWARLENPMSGNFYERLGVEVSATAAEIKLAYRRLASKYHPDKNPGIDRDLFQRIGEAAQVLQDEAARTRYDASLKDAPAASRASETSSSRTRTDDQEQHTYNRSSAPLGWKLFVGRAWDSSRPYEVNLFRNLPLVPETSQGYLYTLIHQLDWSPQGNAAKYFYPLVRAYVESYVGLDFQKMNAAEIQEASKQLDVLMHLPQATMFPDLVTVLIRGGRMDYVLGHLLNQKNWSETPEFKLWVEKVPTLRCRALFL